MKKTILIAFLFLLPIALAQNEPYQYCQDNNTLITVKNVTVYIPEIHRTRTINVEETTICNYGCQNDECLQPPWIAWGIVFAIIVIMVVLYLIFRPR